MCKFLTNMLGLSQPKMEQYKPPAPTAQAVSNDDTEVAEELAEKKKRKKRGFQSTRTAGTILGSVGDGKQTLG